MVSLRHLKELPQYETLWNKADSVYQRLPPFPTLLQMGVKGYFHTLVALSLRK
jgi:hypothetical protein